MSDHTEASSSTDPSQQSKPADNAELIRKQVEYYFTNENLAKDSYLVSLMNSQLYVPISSIAAFPTIAKLTSSTDAIVSAVAESEKVVLSEDKKMIKPNMEAPPRSSLLVRNLPSKYTEEDVRAYFEIEKIPNGSIVSATPGMGGTWIVVFDSEETARAAHQTSLTKQIDGKAVLAQLRSENLQTFFQKQAGTSAPSESSESFPVDSNPLGAPSGFYSSSSSSFSSSSSSSVSPSDSSSSTPSPSDPLYPFSIPPSLLAEAQAGNAEAQQQVSLLIFQQQMEMGGFPFPPQSFADYFRSPFQAPPISSHALSASTNMRSYDSYYPSRYRGRNGRHVRFQEEHSKEEEERKGQKEGSGNKQSQFYYSSSSPQKTNTKHNQKQNTTGQKEKSGKKNKEGNQQKETKEKDSEKGKKQQKGTKKNSPFTYTASSTPSSSSPSAKPSSSSFNYKKGKAKESSSSSSPSAPAPSKPPRKIPLDAFPPLKAHSFGYNRSFTHYTREFIRSLCFDIPLPDCPEEAYSIIENFSVLPRGPLPQESLVNIVLLVKEEQKMQEMQKEMEKKHKKQSNPSLSAAAPDFVPKSKQTHKTRTPPSHSLPISSVPGRLPQPDLDNFDEDDGTERAASLHHPSEVDPLDAVRMLPASSSSSPLPSHPSSSSSSPSASPTFVRRLDFPSSSSPHPHPSMSPAMQLVPSPSPSLHSATLPDIHSAALIGSPALPSVGK